MRESLFIVLGFEKVVFSGGHRAIRLYVTFMSRLEILQLCNGRYLYWLWSYDGNVVVMSFEWNCCVEQNCHVFVTFRSTRYNVELVGFRDCSWR